MSGATRPTRRARFIRLCLASAVFKPASRCSANSFRVRKLAYMASVSGDRGPRLFSLPEALVRTR